MKFDSVIIGGGVAGLSCAIRCAEAGLKTTVIAAGQSALHFSSGSIDVLSRLPDGQPVANPFAAFDALKNQSPDHPYSKLGEQATRDALAWYQSMMEERGIYLTAQNDDSNHLRVTPMGDIPFNMAITANGTPVSTSGRGARIELRCSCDY